MFNTERESNSIWMQTCRLTDYNVQFKSSINDWKVEPEIVT